MSPVNAEEIQKTFHERLTGFYSKITWSLLKKNTEKKIHNYLEKLSEMREGNIWWEEMVGFPAKIDSYHSEDLCAIFFRKKRGGRGKGDDLEDGTEVKSANTPSTIDSQRFTMFNGVNSSDTANQTRVRSLFSKFMNRAPKHAYVIIDHPPPGKNWGKKSTQIDKLRVRIYVIDNKSDMDYRKYMIDGLANQGYSKIQIHIDDRNRANGKGLQNWLSDKTNTVADTGYGQEIFSSRAGCIRMPKVFEATEIDRAKRQWQITKMVNPYGFNPRCVVWPNIRLESHSVANPWRADSLVRCCEEVNLATGIFSREELCEILIGHITDEDLTIMEEQRMMYHCQRLELPKIKTNGPLIFAGQRKSTRVDFENGRGIDKRSAMIYRLSKINHPILSWEWAHQHFRLNSNQEEE